VGFTARVHVDLNGATVTVRQTKFHKSRCLPIHASVVQALTEYRRMRDMYANPDPGAPFFVSRTGDFLRPDAVEKVFRRLRSTLGWRARGDHANLRLHDLRHNSGCRIIPGVWSVVVRMWRRCSAVFGGAS
jgi:integrase